MIVRTVNTYGNESETKIKSFRKAWEYIQEGGTLEFCPDTSAVSLIAYVNYYDCADTFTLTFTRLYDLDNPAITHLPLTEDNFRKAWDMIKAWCS